MTAEKFSNLAKCHSLEPAIEDSDIAKINGVNAETVNTTDSPFINGESVPNIRKLKMNSSKNAEPSGQFFRQKSKQAGYGLAALMRWESVDERRTKFRTNSNMKMSKLFEDYNVSKIKVSCYLY